MLCCHERLPINPSEGVFSVKDETDVGRQKATNMASTRSHPANDHVPPPYGIFTVAYTDPVADWQLAGVGDSTDHTGGPRQPW